MSDRLVISRDGAYQVGDLLSQIVGSMAIDIDTGTIPAGKAVYISSANTVSKADNTSAATALVVGVVVAKNTVVFMGEADGFTGLTPGQLYWLGTDGDVTSTPPTANDSVVVRMGIAKNTTTLVLDVDEVCIL